MIIGLTGAAATGKSWAAGELAAQTGYEYVPSKAAQVAKEIGFDINQEHSFEDRLKYQKSILVQMLKDLSGSANRNVVFDRTPLDLMAYSIMANGNDSLKPQVDQYLTHCRSTLDMCFDMIVLISPPLEQLVGVGEYKEGRITEDAIHGTDHRLVFDTTIKTLAIPAMKKILIVPEELHYQDRVDFIKERIGDYAPKKFF